MRAVEGFYEEKDESIKACLLALRRIILAQDHNVNETQKKAFCYLWTDKKTLEPYVLFVEGKHLNHPNLEIGKRSRMKIFRVNSDKDLPIQTLQQLLNSALDLYRNGTLKA